jgi:hypothetical protein
LWTCGCVGRVGHSLVCCSNKAHTARFVVHHWGPARHELLTEPECRLPITRLFVVGSEQGPTNRSHFSDPALLLLGDTSCFRIHPLMLVAIPALPLLCSDKRSVSIPRTNIFYFLQLHFLTNCSLLLVGTLFDPKRVHFLKHLHGGTDRLSNMENGRPKRVTID